MLLSTNVETLLKKYDDEFSIGIFARAGFDAVDYPVWQLVDDDNRFNGPDYKEIAAEVRRIATAHGVTINQTHAPFTFNKKLLSDPVAYEEIVMPRLIRSIEITALLGGKITAMHPLHYLDYQKDSELMFEMNMDYYRRLLPYAKEYDVRLGIENMFQKDARRGCLTADTCSTSKEFIRYLDTLDDPYAVGLLDVGHVGVCATATEEASDVIRALGRDRLKALHIHDNDYRDDSHMPPFMGKMNWAEITKALGEIDYEGDFTFEMSSRLVSSIDVPLLPAFAEFLEKTGRHLTSEIDRHRPKH